MTIAKKLYIFIAVFILHLSGAIYAGDNGNASTLDTKSVRFIEALMYNLSDFEKFSRLSDMVDSAKVVRINDDITHYELVGVELLGGEIASSVTTLRIKETREADEALGGSRYTYESQLDMQDLPEQE